MNIFYIICTEIRPQTMKKKQHSYYFYKLHPDGSPENRHECQVVLDLVLSSLEFYLCLFSDV